MTLNQILEKNELSVRAYNVCGGNNLYNLNLILDYYLKNHSFKKLRSCGANTNEELIRFCKIKIAKDETQIFASRQKKSFTELTSELKRKQREVINSFITINTLGLSNRSQNAVKSHLSNNLKIRNFALKILDADIDVGKMKNVGKKSIPEIEMYFDIVKDFFKEVSAIEDYKKLTTLRNQFLIQKTFKLKSIPNEILESESIFLIADFLLKKNAFFNKKETLIIKNSLDVYDDRKEVLLEQIGNVLGLSRERVRQVRKKCLEDIFIEFDFLKNFDDDLYSNYGIEENKPFINVDNSLKSRINKLNDTNFSNNFIAFILFTYKPYLYNLIGNLEDVLLTNQIKHRNRHNWKSFYLVNKEISEGFCFTKLLDDVSSRSEDRITETYSFNFKSYLSKFLINDQINLLEEIIPIAEKMVFEELNVIIDLEDNITFKRNTSKLSYEYAYEALEQLGEPSKVKKITSMVKELHPNYDTDEAKIRACMKRIHGFIPVGRKSVYALKKWENELDNFKGGTIRTISQEFLLDFNEPKHKRDIANHVKQFRPKTNANSIYNNLYIDESKTFVFFENYYIGLTSKNYSERFIALSKKARPTKRTWTESLIVLQNFISENDRLPYSSGCPEDEEKLYRWLNVQKGKAKKNQLSYAQQESIKSIVDEFEDSLGKRRTNNEMRYIELKEFVIKNARLPSANKDGEQNLYAFHYKQRKKFEANELDDTEKQSLIEVALALQNQNI